MIVNGQEMRLEKPETLDAFLAAQGYQPERVAVELSGKIVPRAAFGETMLSDADRIEIVCFVGGG